MSLNNRKYGSTTVIALTSRADLIAAIHLAALLEYCCDVPPDAFNRVLWAGMMGDKPYPKVGGMQKMARAKEDDDD